MIDGELQRQKALLAAADAGALVAAVGLAWVTHKPFGDFCPLKPGQWTVIAAGAIGLVFIWIMTARAIGLYRPRSGRMDELFAIVKAACVTWLLALVLGFFAHLEASRLTVTLAFALSIVLVAAGRALTRRSIRYFYAHPDVTVPLVVVGANPIGRYVRDRIVEELSQYEFLGFIDNDPAARAQCGDELLAGRNKSPRWPRRISTWKQASSCPTAVRSGSRKSSSYATAITFAGGSCRGSQNCKPACSGSRWSEPLR